jgi:hypothetical protein
MLWVIGKGYDFNVSVKTLLIRIIYHWPPLVLSFDID